MAGALGIRALFGALCAGGASRFSLGGGRKWKCTCRIEIWKNCDRAIEERSAAQKGYSRKNEMQGVNPSGAKKLAAMDIVILLRSGRPAAGAMG